MALVLDAASNSFKLRQYISGHTDINAPQLESDVEQSLNTASKSSDGDCFIAQTSETYIRVAQAKESVQKRKGIQSIIIADEAPPAARKAAVEIIDGALNVIAGVSNELTPTIDNAEVIIEVCGNLSDRLVELAKDKRYTAISAGLLVQARSVKMGNVNAVTLSGERDEDGKKSQTHHIILDVNALSPLAKAIAILDHEYEHIKMREAGNTPKNNVEEEIKAYEASILRAKKYEQSLRDKGLVKTANDLRDTIIPQEEKMLKSWKDGQLGKKK